ncbi:MAG: hypothetical protein ACE5I1_16025 [bacterium]
MLRFAGLYARPVLISTRKNGRIFKQYSMLSQFNHVLTYIKIDSSEYLLDATDPFRPYNLLPVAALNELGFLVDKENPVWIRIVSPGYFINRTVVSAILHADGSISGWFDSTDEGYSGLFDRRTLRDKNKKEVEYIRDGWLSDLTGAKLDSFTISNRDSIYAPLRTKAFFTSSDHTLVAGDKIFFNPVFFGRRDENPFKLQKRTFPVDFAYGRRLSYTMYLTLPEGCELLERPENISIDLPNNGGQFMHTIYINENQLQVLSDMVIRKPRFEPEEYQALRNFYDRVVAAHAEQVVLQRQSPKVAGKEKSR